MKSLFLRGLRRRVVTRLHRWIGLVIMACMLVAAVTGTWLVFRVEMDRLVNPELRTVQPGTDLVLTATYTKEIAAALIARKLPVYQFPEWGSVEALLKNFEVLGQLVGEEQKAAAMLKADRAVLATAAQKKWPKPVTDVQNLVAAGMR